MKCPKCDYLGFETGDRCKNCGYDFSLLMLADAAAPPADLILRSTDEREPSAPGRAWDDVEIDSLRMEFAAPEPETPPAAPPVSTAPGRSDVRLPLFSRGAHEDEPLIKAPLAPRPPLSVRRTPEAPRLRTSVAPPRRDDADDSTGAPSVPSRVSPASGFSPRERSAGSSGRRDVCGAAPRALAAGIDIALLLAIDLVVVYFTLRMAEVPLAEWHVLPLFPLLAFLTLVKFAYYAVFTAFGGQTIGKMAARIRVVADDDSYLEPARAVQRTLAGIASVLTLGAGFVPALVGPGRRALHDRVAHTRVVALPSA